MIKHTVEMPRKNIIKIVSFVSLMHTASFLNASKQSNLAAHVHGEGVLQFVVDKERNEAELNFKFPALQVLGFEHKPKNSAEKKAHADAHARLKDPKNIFSNIADTKVSPGCVFGESILKIPYMDDHVHAGHGHDHHDHADYELKYKMTCKNIDSLKGFTILAFKNLKSLDKLKVEGLFGEKSVSTELKASNPELLFN